MSYQELSKNPYFFQLRVDEKPPTVNTQAFEEEVIREQRQTIFRADPALRQLFHDDFEAYSRLLDSPEQLLTKLRQWLSEWVGHHSEFPWLRELGDGASEGGEGDSMRELMSDGGEEVYEEDGELNDPLFIRADEWAVRAHRWSHTLYYNKKIKDRDLFRVHANAFAVADLVYASCEVVELEDIPEASALEAAVRQLNIGRTFFGRCLESLEMLAHKHIGALPTVEKLRRESADLREIFDARIEEWEGRLKGLGRWEYFNSRQG